EDRGDLVLGQMGAVQRGAFAFGEPGAAGAAVEQAILAEFAEAAGNGEISGATSAEVRASGIQATKSREVVHGSGCGLQAEDKTCATTGILATTRRFSTSLGDNLSLQVPRSGSVPTVTVYWLPLTSSLMVLRTSSGNFFPPSSATDGSQAPSRASSLASSPQA